MNNNGNNFDNPPQPQPIQQPINHYNTNLNQNQLVQQQMYNQSQNNYQQPVNNQTPQKKNNKKILLIVVAVVLIALIIFVGKQFLGNKGDKKIDSLFSSDSFNDYIFQNVRYKMRVYGT